MVKRARGLLLVGLLGLVGLAPASAAAAEPYVPPAAKDIPGYSEGQIPCKVGSRCPELQSKSLRELAILRNTIYARYGWDGFRKQWLRDYFHAQKWFKPNPGFSYKLISKADRYNAHVIGSAEASIDGEELQSRQDAIYARHAKQALETDLTPDERIEIGLLSRALGGFALDDGKREKAEQSLDKLLEVAELRQLSLRDLRLLRNSIYARRGRPFKSPVIREHFQGMSWYKENPAYTDKLLSATDVRNVRLIRSVEDELGGALRDEDWLIEPTLDGA
jgi:hypothetical protein